MDETKLMNFQIITDLTDSIAYINERESGKSYRALSLEEKNSLDFLLLQYYRESKLISLSYRDKGKTLSYTGLIDRIDLVYKELFLLPKKKIPFSMIVGINR